MNFAEDRPIYLQIMDEIIQQIIAGKLKPGEKISAVREMAVQLSTNPNTVQRSLQELERMNILYSERGKGRNMKHLGFSATEALEKLQHFIEEDQE